jgi:protein-arginine kinase activator protein McsA
MAVAVEATRTCNTCGETKPLADFALVRKDKPWRRYLCTACSLARWNARERPGAHGLTPSESAALIAATGACQACGSTEHLRVDHDHASGRVRGVLCNHCNLALGHTRDDALRLRALADYLED